MTSICFYFPLAVSYQNQYTDTGWFGTALTLLLCFYFLFNIYRAQVKAKRGEHLFIRRIPGLNAIEEAVGRATEMGRPVLMVPGIGGLGPVVVQALLIFSNIAKIAGKFANPILLCCADSAVYTVAQETIRDTYQTEGIIDRYDPDSVRFISDRQFAFAAGVSGLIIREKIAACFFMGDFFAEALIFAETANMAGAIQIASSTQQTQTPFFIASCDYVLIGDEFYAASAYISRQPILTGTITGQDWAKLSLIAIIALGVIFSSWQIGFLKPHKTTFMRSHSQLVPIAKRNVKMSDTFFSHLFNPQDNPKLAQSIHRTVAPKPTSKGGN